MRTLGTQVRLRRLIRAFSESCWRLESEPTEYQVARAASERLIELAEGVRTSWRHESLAGRPSAALDGYVRDSLRAAELAIAGLAQHGADLELLTRDFEGAALPLEVFLRGLDGETALQRSA